MKRFAAKLVLAGAMSLGLLSVPAWVPGVSAQGGISLDPAAADVNVNEAVNVAVKVSGVEDFCGVKIRIAYDTTKVSAQGTQEAGKVTIEPWFTSTGRNLLDPLNRIEEGLIEVDIASWSTVPATLGPSGGGVLFTLRFVGEGAGVTALDLQVQEVKYGNHLGNKRFFQSVNDGQITVASG